MSEVMSAREAAKVAGCSLSTMRRWLSSGRISGASKGDHGWSVERDYLTHFLANQSPIVGSLRERSVTQSPDQRLIDKLESDLHFERVRAEKLETECDSLRTENKQLQEEIKALLKGDNKGIISRWVRTISEVRKSL